MKRLALVVVLALGTCVSLPAQQSSFLISAPSAQPSASSATSPFNFNLVPELALPAPAFPTFASSLPNPAPANSPTPAPQTYSPNDEINRWDLGVGYEYVRFNSGPFSANLNGFHTDLDYNLNNWFALEGNIVSAFGTHVFSDEQSRYVLYTVGGRINAGASRFRLTPWAHILVGGAHLNPQVAHESKNGFALQAGGGVDYLFRSRISFRAEADYVRTQLYSSSQNNFQVGVGAVVHF
ncbi:MAG TPA: outer membrane beta-barrel protein [Candidatus Acidoferrum sp.]